MEYFKQLSVSLFKPPPAMIPLLLRLPLYFMAFFSSSALSCLEKSSSILSSSQLSSQTCGSVACYSNTVSHAQPHLVLPLTNSNTRNVT